MTTIRSILTRRTRMLAVLATAGTGLLVGCASSDEPLTRHEQVLADLTPELRTLHERNVDILNQIAHTDQTNARAFYSDIGRAIYRDRPSRLHPAPNPY